MSWQQRASVITVGIIALGIGVSQIGAPVPISRVYTNSSGVLSGSGLSTSPVNMALTADGVTIEGTGSAGSPFSSTNPINTIRWGFAAGFYGLGTLGNVTTSGNTNATSDMHYNNLTIAGPAPCTYHMLNYRLFVRGTLTIDSGCFLSNSARGVSNNVGSTVPAGYFGLTAGGGTTVGTFADNVTSAPSFFTNVGTSAPGTGCATANCTTATSGADATQRSQGGAAGGTACFRGSLIGTRGGSVTRRTIVSGVEDTLTLYRGIPIYTNTGVPYSGGAGGGAAGSSCDQGTDGAGPHAGGAGGGVLWVAAHIVAGGGTLKADGFDGQDGTCGCGVGVQACSGGSGGGGGGLVILFYGHKSGVTVRAYGGVGGNNSRPPIAQPTQQQCVSGCIGGRGGNGADGYTYLMNMSGDGS